MKELSCHKQRTTKRWHRQNTREEEAALACKQYSPTAEASRSKSSSSATIPIAAATASCSSLFADDRFFCCYINKSEDSLESSEPNKSPLGPTWGQFYALSFLFFSLGLSLSIGSQALAFRLFRRFILSWLLLCYVSCSAKNEEAPACCSRFYSSSRE